MQKSREMRHFAAFAHLGRGRFAATMAVFPSLAAKGRFFMKTIWLALFALVAALTITTAGRYSENAPVATAQR